MFETRCQHLLGDGRCDIYDDRPTICRSHSNDYAYDGSEYGLLTGIAYKF
jgi:Fe-S-cluster containining protein